MAETLLVPLDGSALADAAVPHAVALARKLTCGIVLARIHARAAIVSGPIEMPVMIQDLEWDAQVQAEEAAWLQSRAADLAASSGIAVDAEMRIGSPANQIIAIAIERKVRAIVISTHGSSGFAPGWLGSVADAVVRHAPCPVLAMCEKAVAEPPHTVSMLVLLDGSDISEAILPETEEFARAIGAEVELMRVVAPAAVNESVVADAVAAPTATTGDVTSRATHELERAAVMLRQRGLTVSTRVLVGRNASQSILRHIAAARPGIVAMATHGRGLSRLFLGSVADRVLREGGRPTLIFRPRRDS